MVEGEDFASASTVGARECQEDEWGTHVSPPALESSARLLAVVADGMGGMRGGARASELAVRTFLDSYPAISRPARDRLRHSLAHANRELGIAVESGEAPPGMGCTLVAALFFGDRCEWLSVGDSSILVCRDGELERVNPHHIYAHELDRQVERGEITAEEADRHPDRAALTSAIQGTALDEVAQGEVRLAENNIVMLATDGVSTLSAEEIAAVCTEDAEASASDIAETLISRTEEKERKGQDNATVVVVRHRNGGDVVDVDEPDEAITAVTPPVDADTEPAEAIATQPARSPGYVAREHKAGDAAARPVLWWCTAAFILGVLSALGVGYLLLLT